MSDEEAPVNVEGHINGNQEPQQQPAQLQRLKRSRGGQRGQTTKLFNRAETLVADYMNIGVDQSMTLDTLEGLNDQLTNKFRLLTELETNILNLTSDADFDEESETSGEYQADIHERNHRIKAFVRKHRLTGPVETRSEVETRSDIATRPLPKKTVALPKLQLNTFSGNVLEWTTFSDIFKSSIHNDSSLDDIQKFMYLRSVLTDEASRTVSGLALTEANYAHAVELLIQRYGQTHLIIDAHMTALWNLRKPNGDLNTLRHFYDSLESHVRGLQSLGKEEHTYGELLVPLIREKLPPNIRKQIAREHGNAAWTLPDLRKAILQEINALQAGNPIETTNDASIEPEITAAFYTTATSTKQRPQPVIKTCPFCKGAHFASNCSVVMNTRQRLDIVRRDRLCYNCLGKHRVSECKSRFSCRNCKKRHHTALHLDVVKTTTQTSTESSRETPTNVAVHVTLSKADILPGRKTNFGPVLLKTAFVPISAGNGTPIPAVVLFDEGANKTFVSTKFARDLSAKTTRRAHIKLSTFGHKTENVRSMPFTELIAHELNGNMSTIDAMIIPEISSDLTNHISSEVHELSHLKGLPFAHPVSSNETFPIDVLIGADQYWNFVGSHVISGVIGPTAVSSKFGYLLSGPAGTTKTVDSNARMLHVITSEDTLVYNSQDTNSREVRDVDHATNNEKVQSMWDLELIGVKDNPEVDNVITYESYRDKHLRVEHGKYIAGLPWKEDHPPLPTNFIITEKRTRGMIRRLTPDIITKYNDIITEQRRRDFIEEVDEDNNLIGHYLPHRAVIKESATTPLRIVYDCSCKQGVNFPSLNDCLETGPSLINDLPAILLRFRANNIALTSDIEKAFLNIRLEPHERQFTKFLWLSDVNNPESELVTFQFKAVLFGAVCSPFILNAVIKTHLEIHSDVPTAGTLRNNIYVDNVIDGVNTTEDATTYYAEANELMKTSGFRLRAWSSNNEQLNILAKHDNLHEIADNVSVLGMRWSTVTDELTYFRPNKETTSMLTELITKRDVTSHTAALFDPIGYLAPVHVKAKIFIQLLWKLNLHWDEPLNEDLRALWTHIAKDLTDARNIRVKRRYFKDTEPNDEVELHAYADASLDAYGGVIYLKHKNETAFIMAKTRIAPMSVTTLPRLELMAALIATRLSRYVKQALSSKYNISRCYLWSDSQITLHWINSDKNLPIFVKNRVTEINEFAATRKYCPTDCNPADLLTRGISYESLDSSDLWWNGPRWLKTNDWPVCQLFDATIMHLATTTRSCETDMNLSPNGIGFINRQRNFPSDPNVPEINNFDDVGIHRIIDISRYSDLDKLLRITSYVLRFITKMRKLPDNNIGQIKPTEMNDAENMWVKHVQRQYYGDTIQSLKQNLRRHAPIVQQLNLFVDDNDIIHCGSRIHNAPLDFVTKFPVLIPPHHRLTDMIVRNAHALILHEGVQSTVTQIRQRYWIPKIRIIVRSVISNCVTCLKVTGKPFANPVQAPLPNYRVNIVPAFTVTGVDFTGNLFTRSATGLRGKAYICLFTCAVTRAIHLELVPDMSTRTFLHAFRRFAARRSLPSRMLSDNASTYLAAANELRTLFDTPEMREYLAAHRVQWTFIPKRAPWYGGFWERLIGLTKTAIKKTLGRALITFDELTTVVTEIEAVLNNRPLTYVSSNVDDQIALTPNHLLHGRTLTTLPYISITDEEIEDPTYTDHRAVNDRYEHLSKLHEQFWRRWTSEYLTALRERHPVTGGRNNVIQVGDVVIIHSDIDKRLNWHLGTVTKLIYGNDKLVRSAELNTANGPTNRPIHKLYPLEVVDKELSAFERDNNTTQCNDVTILNDDPILCTDDRNQLTTDVPNPGRPQRDSAVAARIRISDLI